MTPTFCKPNDSGPDSETAGAAAAVPVPVSATDSAEPPSTLTVRVPVRVPIADGVNLTLTVQFAPAASGEPTHVSVATANSALMPSVIVAGVVPVFVTVTGSVPEVVRTGCAAKVSPVAASGDDVMTGAGATAPGVLIVTSVNCSFSTFQRMSQPSPFGPSWRRSPAAITDVESQTLTEPSAFFVTV